MKEHSAGLPPWNTARSTDHKPGQYDFNLKALVNPSEHMQDKLMEQIPAKGIRSPYNRSSCIQEWFLYSRIAEVSLRNIPMGLTHRHRSSGWG